MIALLAALILSQNTPRHPAPATTDTVSVGDGTNWVSRAMPTCNSSTSALQYTPGGTFSCGTIAGSSTSISAVAPLTAVSDGGSGYTIGYTVSTNQVYVGTGTNALTALSLPVAATSTQVLRYDSTGPAFNAIALKQSLWSVFCPSGVSCNDNGTPFMSVMKSAPENYSLSDVSCNAGTAGTGGGNITFNVYNATNAVILTSCTMPCTSVGPTGTSCSLSGGLSAGKEYRVYTTGCTTQPVNMWCNMPLGY